MNYLSKILSYKHNIFMLDALNRLLLDHIVIERIKKIGGCGSTMKCYVHPDAEAVGTCTNCGKTVCSNCALEMNGKLVCKSCVERMATQASSSPPVQPAAQPAAQPAPQPTAPPMAPVAAAAAGTMAAAPVSKKEPIFSIILSFLFPGLGQIYNGQVKKGIVLLVTYVVLWVAIFVVYLAGSLITMGVGALCCMPVFLVPLIEWLYGMYDAYVVANKLNRGEFTKDWLS
jgi:TM2 domain-containing membrane protein YozV